VKTIYITIKIEYDPDKFPEDDMRWAADKVAEAEEIGNIGYDWDSFDITSEVTYHD
jgi:hypothetical protein